MSNGSGSTLFTGLELLVRNKFWRSKSAGPCRRRLMLLPALSTLHPTGYLQDLIDEPQEMGSRLKNHGEIIDFNP